LNDAVAGGLTQSAAAGGFHDGSPAFQFFQVVQVCQTIFQAFQLALNNEVACPAWGTDSAGFMFEEIGEIHQDVYQIAMTIENHKRAPAPDVFLGHEIQHGDTPVFFFY
jgi:hypothetical protein